MALAAWFVASSPMAAVADTRSSRHYHRHSHSGALFGGLFGGAILGLTLGAVTRPYSPPQYIYVDPPPVYYIPPSVPPYPPVPVYPVPDPYAVQPGYSYVPAPVPPQQTAAQRLEDLQAACKKGLMTKQECDAKRKAIIEGM